MAGQQRYLLGVWIAISVLTPLFGFSGARGFAPAVGLMGLLTLVYLRPKGADWIGFGLLALLTLWAAVSLIWSPMASLAPHTVKDFERLTSLHLGLQLLLSGAFVVATGRFEPGVAEKALRWLSGGLVTLGVIMVIEGITQAGIYLTIAHLIHDPIRPDWAVRAVAVGGYVLAALVWPVSAALWRDGRRLVVLFLAATVIFSTVALRGDSPSVALVLSAIVFVLVRAFGRPAVLAVGGVAWVYWLAAPFAALAFDTTGVFARMHGHLPISWDRRLEIWSFTTDRWIEHPLMGWGLDASRTFKGNIALHPHDGALQIWFELGAPGALLLAGFWAYLFWRIAKAADQRQFAATACATATVYLVIGSISFSLWQEWWICVGALALAACVALHRFINEPAQKKAPRAAQAGRAMNRPLSRDSRQVLAIIAAFVLARLITSAVMGLGMDESYTTAISRDLHLSYFDHPPLHQWIAHLAGEAFGYGRWVRLPFIVLFAGASWLMHRLTRRLFGVAAGVWAVLALNLSAFFTLAAGEWVLPDGPLLFCELAAALCLARILFPAPGEAERPWLYWPLAGIWLGLAALSKYQAALVGLGLALACLASPEGRRRLAHPAPWLAALLVLVIASPVLIWNAQHEWVSFAFQSGRGSAHKFKPEGFLTGLLGQAALLAPWVAVPLSWAAWRGWREGGARARFCVIASGPTVLLFTLLPLGGAKVLPHWPMPGWALLFPVLGEALARASAAGLRWPRRWAWISAALLVLLWGVGASDAATAWIKDAFPKTKTDPTAEAIDWRRLRVDLDKRGLLKPGMFVVAAEWNEAGKIDQAVGDAAPVLVFSTDPREYAFRPDSRTLIGHDALIIGRPNTVAQEMAGLTPHFAQLTPLQGFSVGRGDKAEIPLAVILAHRLVTPYPLPSWAAGSAP